MQSLQSFGSFELETAVRIKLEEIAHARSGDKGDASNVGLIAESPELYEVLREQVTADRVKAHFREVCRGPVQRYELPNIRALNFVIVGLLGEGVASSSRVDAQAKGLGEYVRAKLIDIPIELLEGGR